MNTLFDKPRTAEHDANTKPARGEPRAIPSLSPPNGERAGVRDDGASDVAYAYKPGKPTKPINFYCAALEARSVCLMGPTAIINTCLSWTARPPSTRTPPAPPATSVTPRSHSSP